MAGREVKMRGTNDYEQYDGNAYACGFDDALAGRPRRPKEFYDSEGDYEAGYVAGEKSR